MIEHAWAWLVVGGGGMLLLTRVAPLVVEWMKARKAPAAPQPAVAVTVQPAAPAPSLPPRRSEQMQDWMRDTWSKERAEREIAEAQVRADEIAVRRDHGERIRALEKANGNHQAELRVIGEELKRGREATEKNAALLGTIRDHIIRECPRCEDSEPEPSVVRGGAARARP